MDKAEELAMLQYPVPNDNILANSVRNAQRAAFQLGYLTAAKDFALTWKDVAILITIYEQEVEAGNISRYEDEGAPSLQEASEIILKRFKEIRKK